MREINSILKRILPELIALRHDIHAYPEPGYAEHETAKRIVAELEKLPGVKLQKGVAGTGVVGVLAGDKSGSCVALRSDMDCLPIEEQSGKPYASKRPGFMHACGHDGHIACLVGAAKILAEIQDELKGPVKFIFQPAEEGGAGADKMCRAHVLENPAVKGIFGLHGWPDLDIGQVGIRSGPVLASADEFSIMVHGRGTHAAMPHYGVDPILVASHITTALQAISSRFVSPLEPVVVTVSIIQAGTAGNVIPSSARMVGTVRALNEKTRTLALNLVKQIAANVAAAFGASVDIQKCDIGYPPVVNEPQASAYVHDIAASAFGANGVRDDGFPVMGAEDFAFYLEHIPGAFFAIGVKPPGTASYPSLHHPCYDFSDDAIAVGVRMHCEIARGFAARFSSR